MLRMCKPCKSSLSICCSLVGVMDASLAGFQSQMFWKPISQVEVLKVGRQDVGSKAFASHGDTGSCEFPSGCVLLYQGWWLWQDCVSSSTISFSVGFFLVFLISGFLSERIIL